MPKHTHRPKRAKDNTGHQLRDKLLLTTPEAAMLLSVCERHVYQLRKDGKLPFVRVGRNSIRFPRQALEAWVCQRTEGGDSEAGKAA